MLILYYPSVTLAIRDHEQILAFLTRSSTVANICTHTLCHLLNNKFENIWWIATNKRNFWMNAESKKNQNIRKKETQSQSLFFNLAPTKSSIIFRRPRFTDARPHFHSIFDFTNFHSGSANLRNFICYWCVCVFI